MGRTLNLEPWVICAGGAAPQPLPLSTLFLCRISVGQFHHDDVSRNPAFEPRGDEWIFWIFLSFLFIYEGETKIGGQTPPKISPFPSKLLLFKLHKLKLWKSKTKSWSLIHTLLNTRGTNMGEDKEGKAPSPQPPPPLRVPITSRST